MSEENNWCPTQGGTFTGYLPEAYNMKDDEWVEIPIHPSEAGIPFPRRNGGVLQQIFLCGHAQAQALAWGFAAQGEKEGKTIKVRIQPYEVVYDIKARKRHIEDAE